MDALTLLERDHRRVERLFERFEALGSAAHKTRRDLADRIVEELARHGAAEEQIFYPAVRHGTPGAQGSVAEAMEEHHVVKWLLSEIDGMDPADERFAPKVKLLGELVRRHIQEEERELFPALRSGVSVRRLSEIGEALQAAKDIAPSHPHPRMPETPPANVLAGVPLALMDRVRDTFKRLTVEGRRRATRLLEDLRRRGTRLAGR